MFLFCFLLIFIENHKILDSRNTHEKKFCTHEILTRKYFWQTNTHEKNFRTHKILTRKHSRPAKVRWHDDTRSTEFNILVQNLICQEKSLIKNYTPSIYSFSLWIFWITKNICYMLSKSHK